MLRPRFLWKLYAAYVVLALLTTAIVGSMVARRIEQDALQETRRALQTRAILLKDDAASMLDGSSDTQQQVRWRHLGTVTGTRFTVIRLDGTVVVDSEEAPSRLDNQAERPEIIVARSVNVGTATRFSRILGKRVMYVAIPVRTDGQLLGYIRTALPLTAIDAQLAHLRTMLSLGAGVAIVVGLLLGFLLTRSVTQPLKAMTAMAALIADGNYGQQVRTHVRGEVGELADAFNRMAHHLHQRMGMITRERNQLLAVLSSMVEGVIAVDHNEQVVHMNQAAGQILRVSPEASIGKRIWEVTRMRPVVEAVADTIHEASDIVREARIVEAPQEQVIELHASPLRDSREVLAGAVVVLHDMTELHRLENVRREFVANVSHELKTPVTTIKGFVETLSEGALDDRQQAEHFLSIISRNADRLHAVIEDLLSLSRLEHGDELSESLRSEVACIKVLQAAMQDCAAKAAARQVTMTLACDDALRVRINAPLLEQAIVNLLDNAMNYSKAGSTVWLEAVCQGDEVAISVRDQGAGISQEHLSRLFERFYRVDKARSREHGGTGLGLAIVKHIALVHGGRVSVTSQVGLGSTFTIYLPLV